MEGECCGEHESSEQPQGGVQNEQVEHSMIERHTTIRVVNSTSKWTACHMHCVPCRLHDNHSPRSVHQ
jgi:hypothetical protein